MHPTRASKEYEGGELNVHITVIFTGQFVHSLPRWKKVSFRLRNGACWHLRSGHCSGGLRKEHRPLVYSPLLPLITAPWPGSIQGGGYNTVSQRSPYGKLTATSNQTIPRQWSSVGGVDKSVRIGDDRRNHCDNSPCCTSRSTVAQKPNGRGDIMTSGTTSYPSNLELT